MSGKKDRHWGEIVETLRALYPEPKSELVFNGEFELLVSVILSAQCTDKKVNEVTPILFAKFPDPKKLSNAPLSAIENIIRPINYFRTKAKNIKAMAKILVDEFKGILPRSHKELIELPGVGNKTANVVLSELGAANTFPVDTHVFRVSKRLGIATGKNVVEVEESLKKNFAPTLWRPLHHWLIFHGRRVCKAQNPKCGECPLFKYCPGRVGPPVRPCTPT